MSLWSSYFIFGKGNEYSTPHLMHGERWRKMGKEGSKMTEGMEMEGNGDDKGEKKWDKQTDLLPGRKLLSNS